MSLRTEHIRIPDHQHRNRVSQAFNEKNTLAEMLLMALGAMDDAGDTHCLKIDYDRLYVRAGQLEDWQREVAACQSPVPILAAVWARHCKKFGHEEGVGMARVRHALSYSTLPGINDQRLQNLIQGGDGGHLCDLHIHLSGASEFTPVWLYSLAHAGTTYNEIYKALDAGGTRVNFFLHQLRTDHRQILHNLYTAAEVRMYLCRLLQTYNTRSKIPNIFLKIYRLLKGDKEYEVLTCHHPFRHPSVPGNATPVQREGAMWLHAIWILLHTHNHSLARLMHLYLLLMNQHLRLLVQQPDQYGFDQFQYITLAGAREAAESPQHVGFTARFRQFHGMYGPDMKHVEARFSPKSSPEETSQLLTRIWRDYRAATEGADPKFVPCPGCPRQGEESRLKDGAVRTRRAVRSSGYSLGLVAHFIKKPDNDGAACRHRTLRDEIFRKAQALVAVRQSLQHSNPGLYAALVGKDAAANELDTPPEVFAPVFRYLTREGISHTTYHVGEDFVHLLCGIRAVHEAITFLGLCSGDRIGHATALGLDPKFTTGEAIHCAGGQWLDTLIWLSRLLYQHPRLAVYKGKLSQLEIRIARLYTTVYKVTPCPQLPILWKAWELRAYDPRDIQGEHEPIHPFHQQERRAVLGEKSSVGDEIFARACEELQRYHHQRDQWDAVITIRPEDQPGPDLLRAVQDEIIREMRTKNILVEALPTSNVRISRYEVTQDHHLMRWLDPDDSRPAPQVVLGTDDPGIFSTTLRNEYSFILNKFQEQYPGSSEKPYELIRHLMENGACYKFAQKEDTA
ncbi:hypothetical protein [Desulfovibrio sp. ZJ200]|uniref:hypothetical protein n=1 Tax=Desulfovibrio sp. ZJ200 TaxID=2709792 RepID=UPI0013E9D5AB|nr:hypothetical protein [Desulfovibrio sp. ZJ200]